MFSPTCPVAAHAVAAEDAAQSRINYAMGEQQRARKNAKSIVETETLIRRMKQNRGVPAHERYGTTGGKR
jgi:hypothetical protein